MHRMCTVCAPHVHRMCTACAPQCASHVPCALHTPKRERLPTNPLALPPTPSPCQPPLALLPPPRQMFRAVLLRVDDYNAARIKMTAEMADSSQLAKTLVIKATYMEMCIC